MNRDGFQKMMGLVRQGKVSKVIVYKLDRMSRSLSDFMNILQEFKENKVEFVSSQEAFDTSSPYGDLIVKILMVFAEFERTSIINRVSQAYLHRSEMGFYMGGRRPYGFQLVPTVIHNVKTKKLDPIPSEAEQVRYLFEVYAQESVSLRRLVDLMNAEGRQPLDYGKAFHPAKKSHLRQGGFQRIRLLRPPRDGNRYGCLPVYGRVWCPALWPHQAPGGQPRLVGHAAGAAEPPWNRGFRNLAQMPAEIGEKPANHQQLQQLH